MPTLLETIDEPIAPSEADTATARQSSRQLARLLKGHSADTLHLHVPGEETEVAVSGAALRVLVKVLEEMGKGHAVTVLSAQQELTPQQAANFLGMSRTLLTNLLDRQEIPFRYVGSHRRVRFQDLLTFRAEQERRHQAMNELTAQAQELNMGY
jgi:excisionase family DNA binding protein